MHVQPLSSKAKAVSINTPASELMTIDGNQAAAIIAQLCNEVIAIHSITPASPIGEWVSGRRRGKSICEVQCPR